MEKHLDIDGQLTYNKANELRKDDAKKILGSLLLTVMILGFSTSALPEFPSKENSELYSLSNTRFRQTWLYKIRRNFHSRLKNGYVRQMSRFSECSEHFRRAL